MGRRDERAAFGVVATGSIASVVQAFGSCSKLRSGTPCRMSPIVIGGAGGPRYPVSVIDTQATKVIHCRGALATERRLFTELDALISNDLDDLALPVRIIVPSRSLRLHLLRRLVRERGAVAGVVIQTMGGLAREIMERSSRPLPGGEAGFEVLVRRCAELEPVLAAELEDLSDGYDVVQGAVRDLVDAGFEPAHEEGVLERLAELANVVPRSNRDRAAALTRVTARALESAEITNAEPQAARYKHATEALRDHGAESLPSRGILVHGFADLTGVAADLLTTVLREMGGVVLVDRVPDPSQPERSDSGNSFLDRLELTVGGLKREGDDAITPPPEIDFAEAPDVETEARWVAETVRSILDGRDEPEDIGVVARHLGQLGPALRRHMGRLGVPFSGVGAQVPGGLLRRKARRLADLLRLGGRADLDLWLEVVDDLDGGTELLLGMRVLSLARLRDLVDLAPTDVRLLRDVPLPVGDTGSTEDSATDHGAGPRLSAARLVAARGAAERVLDALENSPDRVAAGEHRVHTMALLSALGWDCRVGFAEQIASTVCALEREFPVDFKLRSDEWSSALIGRLEKLGETPIGGAGGGVQLLTVMEARARTFSHLIVCGCNRGVFPRIINDDALLPDLVRSRLALDVLPEMPVKARSADEERYLFAQLVSSAPRIRLSWHLAADGRRTAPSPFAERLAVAGRGSVESTPPVWSMSRPRPGPRPAYEHAVLAAVVEGKGVDSDLVALALAEGRGDRSSETASVPPQRLATSRVDVIRAAEPDDGPPVVGPWSGFVGTAATPGDRLWITRLEGVATCPWQSFLSHRLGVRPLPDPHLGLPDPDHRLVGAVVHDVLERIVIEATGGTRLEFDEALERAPVTVPWPPASRVDGFLEEAARRIVFDEGLSGFGLARLLVAAAVPVLAVAADVEWHGGTALEGVLASEITGAVAIPASGRTISFRADRLDRGPEVTDYKTGRPLSDAKKPETRFGHLLKKVSRGRVLQAVAYALAGSSDTGTGRYVYLKPDIGDAPPECRVLEATASNGDLCDAFWGAVATIEAALDEGAVFPRVREADGKDADHCRLCSVAEGCRRDDSVFRRNLESLLEGDEPADTAALCAARRLWWLGVEREAGS